MQRRVVLEAVAGPQVCVAYIAFITDTTDLVVQSLQAPIQHLQLFVQISKNREVFMLSNQLGISKDSLYR